MCVRVCVGCGGVGFFHLIEFVFFVGRPRGGVNEEEQAASPYEFKGALKNYGRYNCILTILHTPQPTNNIQRTHPPSDPISDANS